MSRKSAIRYCATDTQYRFNPPPIQTSERPNQQQDGHQPSQSAKLERPLDALGRKAPQVRQVQKSRHHKLAQGPQEALQVPRLFLSQVQPDCRAPAYHGPTSGPQEAAGPRGRARNQPPRVRDRQATSGFLPAAGAHLRHGGHRPEAKTERARPGHLHIPNRCPDGLPKATFKLESHQL